MQYHSNKIHLP